MDINGQNCQASGVNVALTPQLEALIRRKLASGMYKNAAEVVREGLRLLAEEDEWKKEVRTKVAAGVAQLRTGRVVDGEKAVEGVLRRVRPRGRKGRG
jgi:antitoxin ParD1/3/4